MKNKLLSLLVAGTMLTATATAQAERTGVWTGVDFAPDSFYVYLGAVTGIQGQDIQSQDGWLIRGDAGYGEYDYDTIFPGPTPTNVEGDVAAGDILIGYRHFFGNGSVTGFLGGEIQNHDQSPRDLANSVDGSEGGVKGQLEIYAEPVTNVSLSAIGSYSSAFDSYWSRFFGGYNFGPVTIGPEVYFLGNEEFDQFRVGGALTGFDIGFASVRLYGGYADNDSRGDDGAYGGVGFGANF